MRRSSRSCTGSGGVCAVLLAAIAAAVSREGIWRRVAELLIRCLYMLAIAAAAAAANIVWEVNSTSCCQLACTAGNAPLAVFCTHVAVRCMSQAMQAVGCMSHVVHFCTTVHDAASCQCCILFVQQPGGLQDKPCKGVLASLTPVRGFYSDAFQLAEPCALCRRSAADWQS